MNDYPSAITQANQVEPAPRRVRGVLAGQTVFDTTHALYVWEWPFYPQYYIPLADVQTGLLTADGPAHNTSRGTEQLHTLRAGDAERRHAVRVLDDSPLAGLAGTARFDWDALDAWYEEDEQVFVHPRSPYTRVDALRSTRRVRVEIEGTVLAESASPVLVFETGLPTRYYLNRTEVDFSRLIPSATVTSCPYKGTTSAYWSFAGADTTHADIAWSYDFPTRQLLPITGLVAFYNEKVDTFLDGELLDRPQTPFSNRAAGDQSSPGPR